MRITPASSPFVGYPAHSFPNFTSSAVPPAAKIKDGTVFYPDHTSTMQDQSRHAAAVLGSTASETHTLNLPPQTVGPKQSWYLRKSTLALFAIIALLDTLVAIIVFAIQHNHSSSSAGYIVWLTVSCGITSVLLSLLFSLHYTRHPATVQIVNNTTELETGVGRSPDISPRRTETTTPSPEKRLSLIHI